MFKSRSYNLCYGDYCCLSDRRKDLPAFKSIPEVPSKHHLLSAGLGRAQCSKCLLGTKQTLLRKVSGVYALVMHH